MDSLRLWGKAPILTIEQAAFLSCDLDPNNCENTEPPKTVSTMLNMIQAQIMDDQLKDGGNGSSRLNALIISDADQVGWSRNTESPEYFYQQHPDYRSGVDVRFYKKPNWRLSTVRTENLKHWLTELGIRPAVFFGQESDKPKYLEPSYPRYSAQLAAAVNVWEAMEDSALLAGKAVKAALTDWLNTNDHGISKSAIGECVKVANWNEKGGATKTPTR